MKELHEEFYKSFLIGKCEPEITWNYYQKKGAERIIKKIWIQLKESLIAKSQDNKTIEETVKMITWSIYCSFIEFRTFLNEQRWCVSTEPEDVVTKSVWIGYWTYWFTDSLLNIKKGDFYYGPTTKHNMWVFYVSSDAVIITMPKNRLDILWPVAKIMFTKMKIWEPYYNNLYYYHLNLTDLDTLWQLLEILT